VAQCLWAPPSQGLERFGIGSTFGRTWVENCFHAPNPTLELGDAASLHVSIQPATGSVAAGLNAGTQWWHFALLPVAEDQAAAAAL
jgi:hypothetical protein